MSLVENIRNSCTQNNLTIQELEQQARLSENSIYRWDRNTPSVDKVKKVADVLGTTVDRLLRE